jgi:ubiquinone/menaquinone biosynthesis C-methylase UbiE
MLIATDLSDGMRKQAAKKCRKFRNVRFRYADLMHLKCADCRFDKVVAGNVLHLLDEPELALKELLRVCKKGGKVIIPTYINSAKGQSRVAVKLLSKLGIEFKKQFDIDSYKQFFADMGFPDAEFEVADGRMPCAIAIITKNDKQ